MHVIVYLCTYLFIIIFIFFFGCRKVLKGGDVFNAKTNSVILNAGMGLYVYGLASSIEEGIEIARDVLRSGKGLVKLDEWIEVTQMIQQQSSSS